uniref:MTD1m n=1 Tax=Chlamydomonas reinhardtii TaxID=3055 RepID=D5LB13_CHLRE|nr:MTD1m [Chlamydomonas reinhardtii]
MVAATPVQFVLPPLPEAPTAAAARLDGLSLADSGGGAGVRTVRLREALYGAGPYESADASMAELAAQIASLDRDKARSALAAVWQATVLGRPNRAANQVALAAAGGVLLLVDVAVQRLAGVRLEGGARSCSREDEEEAVMALLVLENLSCNVSLHRDMVLGAPGPHLLQMLVALAKDNTAAAAVRVNAAKVLVNLTFSQIELAAAATEAGALPAAVSLLQAGQKQALAETDAEVALGLHRQGAWLLSHLTAGQGCQARELLAAQPQALARIKDLLTTSRDTATLIRCCEVVCNLARGDVGPHAELMRAGLVQVLLKLVEVETEAPAPTGAARSEGSSVDLLLPALTALAALAAGGAACARGLLAHAPLLRTLTGALEWSNLISRDHDLSRVMLAAHSLVYVLGRFALRNRIVVPGVRAGVVVDAGMGATPAAATPQAQQVLQESGYVSFAAAMAALGLQQPRYTAAILGKELESGPHSAVASAAYQVNTELLPMMRHDNARMVVNTCARLYQIAVCLRDSPECRSVLSNTSLSLALSDLLRSQHSSVLQAALCLTDALAALPEVVPQLAANGVLDRLCDLLHNTSAQLQEHKAGTADTAGDPLVVLLAERALVTMFLTRGQHQAE